MDSANHTGSASCSVTVTPPPTVNKVTTGDTATIGFWQNKNGQAIILSLNGSATSNKLANWLASTFPALYGAGSSNNLTNKTNTDVANLFLTFFNVKGTKTDAQVMAGALAAYVTNATLAGSTVAGRFGFTLTAAGTGSKYWNTGSNGAAIGLANNTDYTHLTFIAANVLRSPRWRGS